MSKRILSSSITALTVLGWISFLGGFLIDNQIMSISLLAIARVLP